MRVKTFDSVMPFLLGIGVGGLDNAWVGHGETRVTPFLAMVEQGAFGRVRHRINASDGREHVLEIGVRLHTAARHWDKGT